MEYHRYDDLICGFLPDFAASMASGYTWMLPCPVLRRAAEFRHLHDGVESADSYCFICTSGCSPISLRLLLRGRSKKTLIQTLSVLPEYLRNKATCYLMTVTLTSSVSLSVAQVVVRAAALRN